MATVRIAVRKSLPDGRVFRPNPCVSGYFGFFGNRREPVAEQGV
jgi:hypothetical protein